MAPPTLRVPARLELLIRLTEALKSINYVSSDGRAYDMREAVYRGRVHFGDDDPLPMFSILEVPLQDEGLMASRDGTAVKQSYDLVIQGFVPDDHDNPTDPAHYALAAVKSRLVDERRRANDDDGILGMEGYVDGLSFNAGVVRPPDETSAVAHFWLTVYVELVEDLAEPFWTDSN